MIACVGAALLSTVSSFLFNPKNDAYCKAYGPLIMIPLQVMLSILIARLQRIISVVSPLIHWQNGKNRRGRQKQRKKMANMLPSWMDRTGSSLSQSDYSVTSNSVASNDSSGSNARGRETERTRFGGLKNKFSFRPCVSRANPSLRSKFTERKLWILVCIITLPQIIAQVFGLIVYPQTMHYIFNDDESEGRAQCINDDFDHMHWIEYAIIFLTTFILVYQCQKTKR